MMNYLNELGLPTEPNWQLHKDLQNIEKYLDSWQKKRDALGYVIDGVVASKIAAHAADIARGIKGARERDDEMARARSNLDWDSMYNLSLNPEKARHIRKEQCSDDLDTCTMCGDYCSAKINKEVRGEFK